MHQPSSPTMLRYSISSSEDRYSPRSGRSAGSRWQQAPHCLTHFQVAMVVDCVLDIAKVAEKPRSRWARTALQQAGDAGGDRLATLSQFCVRRQGQLPEPSGIRRCQKAVEFGDRKGDRPGVFCRKVAQCLRQWANPKAEKRAREVTKNMRSAAEFEESLRKSAARLH